jgi:hypothetical protein
MPVRTVAPVDKTDDVRPGGSFRERDGQESVHSYVTDHHKYLWVGAGEFHSQVADATTQSHQGGMACHLFPVTGAGKEMVCATVWRPKKWVNGIISFDYYFNENVNAGDTVIHYEVSTWSTGDVIAGARDMLNQNVTTTAQAAANTLWKKHWGYDTTPTPSAVTNNDEFIGVGVGRNANSGDDTLAGNLRFFGCLLTYVPTNRQ